MNTGLKVKLGLVFFLIVLAVVTVAVYWPVTTHEFVGYDDDLYVTANPRVGQGLTRDSVAWAMTAEVSANWPQYRQGASDSR